MAIATLRIATTRAPVTDWCADRGRVIAENETFPAGRTTTAQDDWLTQAVARLPEFPALLLALAIYCGVGLVLPLLARVTVPAFIGLNMMGALFGWSVTLAWLYPVVEGRLRRQLLERTSSLRSLSAREFELVVGELFRREGWRVEETGRHGAGDGNVDLRISRGSEHRLVQCKRWQAWKVGVDEVRKLAGVLMRDGLAGSDGLLVTSSEFTPAAVAEAKQTRIELIDGDALVRRLEAVGAHDLLVRSKAAATTWLCPRCSTPMVLDRSPHGWWLHCPDYRTSCDGKHDLGVDGRQALERVMAGA